MRLVLPPPPDWKEPHEVLCAITDKTKADIKAEEQHNWNFYRIKRLSSNASNTGFQRITYLGSSQTSSSLSGVQSFLSIRDLAP